MLLTAFLLLLSVLAIIAMVTFVYCVVKAPEGIEDETGFHVVERKQPAPSRYFSVRAKERSPAKAYKAHQPAS